jgi:hypothetical protein
MHYIVFVACNSRLNLKTAETRTWRQKARDATGHSHVKHARCVDRVTSTRILQHTTRLPAGYSMVYLSLPHLASALRLPYAPAYNTILATHRRSPLTSASSVIILVAPDVDALCAARMLADLFKHDDVMHRIILSRVSLRWSACETSCLRMPT